MAEQKSFVFIPDISGFTEFVKSVEITHSKHIITELLELIIESNILDMEVSEIEGDAILFYKLNSTPTAEEVIKQVEHTYKLFHTHLKKYDKQRICQCGACSSASNLKIKFIAHSGEIQKMKVKSFEKIYGEDLILAHRMLKNDLTSDEYLLMSNSFDGLDNKTLNKTELSYDNFGELEAYFTELFRLYKDIPEPSYKGDYEKTSILNKINLTINSPIEELFQWLSDFKYRSAWNKDVKNIIYDDRILNQGSTKHVCVINNNQEIEFETLIDERANKDKWIMGEKLVVPILGDVGIFYILTKNKQKKGSTDVEVEIYAETKSLLAKVSKPIFKYKLTSGLEKSLINLKALREG